MMMLPNLKNHDHNHGLGHDNHNLFNRDEDLNLIDSLSDASSSQHYSPELTIEYRDLVNLAGRNLI
jgi:hypothetical protein